ncbi:NADPH:quinone reductase [Actinoplanes sp. NPDC051411]|uniref:NADPH:quinone reductase n=1 Tax=Actinoplanes sp. NPDC051411 TaxID=3155522 RepID=UPI0034259256
MTGVRAAYVDRPGPAGEIRYGELAAPVPGPTDVLVDVEATTVNHVDTFVRSGTFRTPMPLPFVVGRDLIGVVARAGAGAPGFRAGDRVWCNSLGHGGRQGAAAERVVVPADRLYPLPPGVPAEAVTVLHPAATAYLGLVVHGRLRPGETVVVGGGGGNVGAALITLAAALGGRVVATAAPRDAAFCRSAGAGEVIDYAAPDLGDRLSAACPEGIDVYLDTSGRNDLGLVVGRLAFRGRIVLLAGIRSRPVLPAGDLYLMDRSVTGFVISHATTAELAEAAAVLNRLLATGRLRAREVVPFPLSAIAEAHQLVEDGKMNGRRALVTVG